MANKHYKTIIVDVKGCSACGKDHARMSFKRLLVPKLSDGKEYWYYALCPIEKIVIYVTEDRGG